MTFRSCCCLPTPMTLASEGSPMFPLVVHQPAFPSSYDLSNTVIYLSNNVIVHSADIHIHHQCVSFNNISFNAFQVVVLYLSANYALILSILTKHNYLLHANHKNN